MAHIYGISGLEEAKAYLEHSILSERLYKICGALLEHKGANIVEIFGDIDTLKLRSSMTLFSLTSEDYTIFDEILDAFFEGQMDEATLKLLLGALLLTIESSYSLLYGSLQAGSLP